MDGCTTTVPMAPGKVTFVAVAYVFVVVVRETTDVVRLFLNKGFTRVATGFCGTTAVLLLSSSSSLLPSFSESSRDCCFLGCAGGRRFACHDGGCDNGFCVAFVVVASSCCCSQWSFQE